MKWYKRDPDAALVGFRGLSHDAKSAYGTIIDLSYSRDGDVPDDEHLLCMHIECRPQWWRRVKQELLFHQKIRIISGKLVANRVETTLKEAANFSETQSKRAREGWVSRKNNSRNNEPFLPLGNANTTTTTYKEGISNLKDKGVDHRASLELQLAQKRHLGISPDEGMDYRSPPKQKSDNPLAPLPDREPEKQKEAANKAEEGK
jgi:hypothetical protein